MNFSRESLQQPLKLPAAPPSIHLSDSDQQKPTALLMYHHPQWAAYMAIVEAVLSGAQIDSLVRYGFKLKFEKTFEQVQAAIFNGWNNTCPYGSREVRVMWSAIDLEKSQLLEFNLSTKTLAERCVELVKACFSPRPSGIQVIWEDEIRLGKRRPFRN